MKEDQVLWRELAGAAGALLECFPRKRLIDIARLSFAERIFHLARHGIDGRSLAEVVGSLFEDRPREHWAEIARQITVTELKNYLCMHCWWRMGNFAGLARFVRCPEAQRLQDLHRERRPAILVFWHLGPRFSVGPGLQRIGVPALIFAKPPMPLNVLKKSVALPGLEYLVLSQNPGSRAVALKRGLEHLEKGGLIAIGADGVQGEKFTDVSFLGRRLRVGRGPAALARLTGAPIVPITLTWGSPGWTIDFDIFEAIPRPPAPTKDRAALDLAQMQEIASWFEKYTCSHPEQLRLHRLRNLASAPRFTPGEAAH